MFVIASMVSNPPKNSLVGSVKVGCSKFRGISM